MIVGVVSKYAAYKDAYKTVYEEPKHGSLASNIAVEILPTESDNFQLDEPQKCDDFLLPGGFGIRDF